MNSTSTPPPSDLVSDPAAEAAGGAPPATLVRVAFSLGWTMSDLYADGLPAATGAPHADSRLPGISALRPSQRADLRLDQVDAALSQLATAIGARRLTAPKTGCLRAARENSDPAAANRCKSAIYDLHVQLLRVLTATDPRLGRVYGLGRALADSCRATDSREELTERFAHYRLDTLRAWLNDSASILPEHAARAVLGGLTRWEAWVANISSASVSGEEWSAAAEPVGATLRRQGELWRSVLSGEKDALDMLNADSYVRAASTMAQRALALAGPFLKKRAVLLPLLALSAVAIVLVVWGLIDKAAAQLTAGIAAAAAALGVSWKTVGATAQRLAAAVEKPLWRAEIDTAVSTALTFLPSTPRAEPRPDILLDAPKLLGAIEGVGSAKDIEHRKLRRPRQLRFTPAPELEYLLNWSRAVGYLQTSTTDGHVTDSLTPEGTRLAQVSPRERANVRCALAAAHGATASAADASGAQRGGADTAPEPAAASVGADA